MIEGETRAVTKASVALACVDRDPDTAEQEVSRSKIVKYLQTDLNADTNENKIEETT
jgi:hypothetical protein